MSEMVERVALAICPTHDRLCGMCIPKAHDAIFAMREMLWEPTEKMLEAVNWEGDFSEPDDLRAAWKAMLGVAFAECP